MNKALLWFVNILRNSLQQEIWVVIYWASNMSGHLMASQKDMDNCSSVHFFNCTISVWYVRWVLRWNSSAIWAMGRIVELTPNKPINKAAPLFWLVINCFTSLSIISLCRIYNATLYSSCITRSGNFNQQAFQPSPFFTWSVLPYLPKLFFISSLTAMQIHSYFWYSLLMETFRWIDIGDYSLCLVCLHKAISNAHIRETDHITVSGLFPALYFGTSLGR